MKKTNATGYPLLGGLLAWLGILNVLLSRFGLRGLSWGGPLAGGVLALLGVALRGRPSLAKLRLALFLAVPLQIALATLLRRSLNPKLQLAPGLTNARMIERIDLPGAHGPVPALHIVPHGGAQAAVCVAHGSGGDKTFYAWRLADALISQGLAVVLIDLDGHGESPRPQSFPDIIESVAGPARWLAERYARVGLLGMSLGGAVTVRAVAEGAPCNALALWEVPPRLRLDNAAYRRVQLTEARRIARPTLIHLFRDGTIPHIVGAWKTSGIRATIGTWDLFDALDLLGSLVRIREQGQRPPVYLIYAGRDAVVPMAEAERVRDAAQGWARFDLLERATHLSLPIEPETIARTATWLAQELGAKR